MPDLTQVYNRSPILVQNAMATAYGVRERVLRRGGAYGAFLEDLERDQWLPAAELAEIQARRLRTMVAFAATQVPHYRDLFARLGLDAASIRTPEDLRHLPLLDKEEVRAAPERFVPERATERLIPSATGGTTGTPLRYLVTPTAVQYNYATYEARFRRWAGVRFGQRTATLNGQVIVPAGQRRPPFWRHNLAFHQLYLSAYHLSPTNLPAYVDRLRRFAPEVIVGYVSTVHVLARHILEEGLQGAVRPCAVLLSSETLLPRLRTDIEAAFHCRAFNGYSLGELTAFISECPAGSLHASPEYGVIELLDRNGGTELVATGLFNQAMPLLRYRTGDAVEAAGPGASCPCSRSLPLVGEILGRADDQVVTPDGSRVGPAALSLAFQSARGLRQAQVVQRSERELDVLLAVTEAFDQRAENGLRAELTARLGPGLRLHFERVDEIPRTVGGKQRLIVSEL